MQPFWTPLPLTPYTSLMSLFFYLVHALASWITCCMKSHTDSRSILCYNAWSPHFEPPKIVFINVYRFCSIYRTIFPVISTYRTDMQELVCFVQGFVYNYLARQKSWIIICKIMYLTCEVKILHDTWVYTSIHVFLRNYTLARIGTISGKTIYIHVVCNN